MNIAKSSVLAVLFSHGLAAATVHRGFGPEPDSLDVCLSCYMGVKNTSP